MKLSKRLHKFSIITILFLVVYVSITVIDNYNNSSEFYRNTKTFFLSLFIVNILITSYLKKYQNFFINKLLTTFSLCLLTFSFLALFINKLIFTGFKNEIILYNQISSIIFGILSFALVISQHYYNLKIEKNMA